MSGLLSRRVEPPEYITAIKKAISGGIDMVDCGEKMNIKKATARPGIESLS